MLALLLDLMTIEGVEAVSLQQRPMNCAMFNSSEQVGQTVLSLTRSAIWHS